MNAQWFAPRLNHADLMLMYLSGKLTFSWVADPIFPCNGEQRRTIRTS